MKTTVEIKKLDERAIVPSYGTEFSAGADIYALCDEKITINPHETCLIHTGISMSIPNGLVGLVFARSGMATKRSLAPANKVGVIDSDYYNSDNEGHIILKISNDTKENKTLVLDENKGICQGIFFEYGITIDDDTNEERNGGFGSTN